MTPFEAIRSPTESTAPPCKYIDAKTHEESISLTFETLPDLTLLRSTKAKAASVIFKTVQLLRTCGVDLDERHITVLLRELVDERHDLDTTSMGIIQRRREGFHVSGCNTCHAFQSCNWMRFV